MISVTIIVKNGERKLKEVLDSLSQFNEVVVCDTGSKDKTLEIAKQFSNVVIYQKEFQGFGKTHNEAAALAKHPWILSIDADEVVSPELSKEILTLSLDQDNLYAVPRLNFFNGKKITFGGWYPESRIRLYNKTKTHFSENLVHESVVPAGLKTVSLKNPLYHYPYENISDFLQKMELYSSLFAEEKKGKKKSSPLIALSHALGAFFKSYIIKKGFTGGYEGFLIACYNSHTAFYKYLKLYHKNKK